MSRRLWLLATAVLLHGLAACLGETEGDLNPQPLPPGTEGSEAPRGPTDDNGGSSGSMAPPAATEDAGATADGGRGADAGHDGGDG